MDILTEKGQQSLRYEDKMLGVIKDNPSFLPWLNAQVHGAEKTIQCLQSGAKARK